MPGRERDRGRARNFTGVVVTDGRGSPRDDLYKDYTDEEMRLVRFKEQRKAAVVGEYAAQVILAGVRDADYVGRGNAQDTKIPSYIDCHPDRVTLYPGKIDVNKVDAQQARRVLDLVQTLGLDESTIFIFTSDNGPLHSQYGGTDSEFFNSHAGRRGQPQQQRHGCQRSREGGARGQLGLHRTPGSRAVAHRSTAAIKHDH